MDINEILKALIDDEVEAVNGYNKALEVIKHPAIIKKLTEIRDEEVKHIEELNKQFLIRSKVMADNSIELWNKQIEEDNESVFGDKEEVKETYNDIFKKDFLFWLNEKGYSLPEECIENIVKQIKEKD